MVIDFSEIEKIIEILHEVHPYEEPAYEFWQINFKN